MLEALEAVAPLARVLLGLALVWLATASAVVRGDPVSVTIVNVAAREGSDVQEMAQGVPGGLLKAPLTIS